MAFDIGKYQKSVYADDNEEQQENTSAPKTAWDRFIENPFGTIGEIVTQRSQMDWENAKNSTETVQEMAQGAVNTAQDVAQAYQDFGEKRSEFLQRGAELQKAYTPEALEQASETGDYSAQSVAIQNAQEAGDESVTATRNLILSPGRQMVRSFVNAYEDDNSDSLLANTAHSIEQSNAGIEYLMTDEERLQKAKLIEEKTGIPTEAILGDTKAFSQAMDVYRFAVKNDAYNDDLWNEFPELKAVANMSSSDAAIALHHIDDIRNTHGIIETFTHFLEVGNKNLEYNNLQYKIFMGTADDNDRQRAADLRAQLEQEMKQAPSFFDSPGASIAAGVAQSLPEMWQSTVQALDDAAIMASMTMLAGAAAGAPVAGVGAVPGAVGGAVVGGVAGFARSVIARQSIRSLARAGLNAGARVGAFRGMLRPEVGQRYAEYKELKDKDGNPLLTDDEAKWYALAGGAANAGIELFNFGTVTKAFSKAPHASRVFADIIKNTGARMEAHEAFKLMARDKAADMFKITLSESGEEALQSVSDDLVHNDIVSGRNTQESAYSASTMAGHAFQSFAESLPGSMGFGLFSGVGGGITTTGKLGVEMRNRAKFAAKYGADARQTVTGTLMLEELQQAIASGKMHEKAPEIQRQILKEQLAQTEYQDAYIDTEVALMGKNGQEDLQKAAEAGGYTSEELQIAIAEKGHLLVPTERLAQAGTSPELLDAVTFSQEAEAMGRMRTNAKATMDAVQKQQQEVLENQMKLFDNIVDEYYPTDKNGKNQVQRDTLKAVIFTNPQNPAQGWRKIYNDTHDELYAILEPALDALNAGMGHAGLGEITDEVGNKKTIYTSDNAPWYRNFYKVYKRRPTKTELEDMAAAMMTGESDAPQVQGFIFTTQEEHEAAQAIKPEIDALRTKLANLNEIKKAATSLTGAEMQITEGLSKEAFHLYRDLTQKLVDVDGNIKGKNARQARMGALLVARHADRWAEVVTKSTGKKVTALDWYKNFAVTNEENPVHMATGKELLGQNATHKELKASYNTFQKNKDNDASPASQALTWFQEHYPEGVSVQAEGGTVRITRRSIKDTIAHGFRKKKLVVIPTLVDGIKQAKLVRSMKDYDNPQLSYDYYVYEVNIEGEKNYVLCRVKKSVKGARLYIHEVATEAEINKMSDSLNRGAAKNNGQNPRGIALYTSILSDFIKSVNQEGKETLDQRAWHGSPYEFERFDLGEIGSGEGNQVHGWGLYFAKNRKVSEAYKETFGDKGSYVELNGRYYRINDEGDYEDNYGDVTEYGSALETAIGALEEKQNRKDALAYLHSNAEEYQKSENEGRRQWAKTFLEAAKLIEQDDKAVGFKGGRLYSVEIPEENEMLDEQKHLDEQSIEIQEKIFSIVYGDNFVKALEVARDKGGDKGYQMVLDALTLTSAAENRLSAEQEEKAGQLYEEAVKIIGEDNFEQAQSMAYDVMTGFRDNYKAPVPFEIRGGLELSTVRYMNGRSVYERMIEGGQKKSSGGRPKDVSLTLKQYGIKGITYDGQRDGRCFVVFDDQAVQVIERYNQMVNQAQGDRLGFTSFYEDGYRIVSLLENSNESTFMHEMAHIFLKDLEQLAGIDSVSQKSLELVNDWASWHKGAAQEYAKTPWAREFANREQAIIDAEAAGDLDRVDSLKDEWRQERFARAFEIYLRDGQAPARGLKAVFRAFAKFLRRVYLAFTSDGGRASEPVRRVMDRMIATEDEIEAAALDDRYKDVEKAGGEKLFEESESDTYKRWWQESLEEAKEKLRKVVFKDLEDERQREFDRRVAIERARKEKELQGEDIYLALRALEETNYADLNIVLNWFGSLDEFQQVMSETPPLQEALDAWMKDYSENLDKELLQAEITDEVVDKAMMGTSYQAKLEALTGKAFAQKQALIRSINGKVEQAMRSVEEKLEAVPDDVDLKVDKSNNAVKELWKAINRLRFSSKWSAEDTRHIESLLRSATKEEARKQYKEFKEKARAEKAETKEKTRQQKQQAREEKRQNKENMDEAFHVMEDEMKLFRQQAKEIIAQKPLHEAMDIYNYKRLARQAARRVRAAINAKNWDIAAKQHRQKIMFMLEADEAQKMRERVQKHLDKIKRQLNARSVRLPQQERYWLRHLAFALGLTNRDANKPSGTKDQTPEQIMSINFLFKLFDQLAEQHDIPDADGPKAVIDFLTRKTETADGKEFKGKKWKQLNIAEFENVVDTLNILYTTGRDKFRMKSIGGKDIQEVLDEITTETSDASYMHVNRKRVEKDTGGLAYNDWLGKISPAMALYGQEYVASMTKPEEILRALGTKAHKYIYGLYERASQKEGEMIANEMTQLKKILKPFSHSERMNWKKKKYSFVTADGKERFSKEEIICMALNRGNNTNWLRLLGGLGVDEEDGPARLAKFIDDHMTSKDWDLVQAIWDNIDQYWDETVAVEEKLNGVALQKVEARPFIVSPQDGQTRQLRGGYYPIVYDPKKSSRQADLSQNAELRSQMSGAQVFGANRGFTKGRSENAVKRPLLLTFDVITDHVYQVTHNIAYRIAARDVYRLVNSSQFESYVADTLGRPYYNVLKEWSTDVWAQVDGSNNVATKWIDKAMNYLRSNSVMAIMGYRLWPAVENISNIGPVMEKLGPIKTQRALLNFYLHRKQNMQLLYKSVFMRNRINSMDRDIRSQDGLFHADFRPFEIIRGHAYDMMLYSDLALSAPLWVQSFKDAYGTMVSEVTNENERNVKAIEEAQRVLTELKAQQSDLQMQMSDRNMHMDIRHNGTEEQKAKAKESPFAVHSDEDLNNQQRDDSLRLDDLKKKIFEAEEKLNRAAELDVLTDEEVLQEAERRAVAKADSTIRDTFGSGETKDLSSIQRQKQSLYRLLTVFYSFFNTQFNALFAQYRQGRYSRKNLGMFRRWAPLMKGVFYRLIVMSLVGYTLKFWFGLDGSGDDDKWRKIKDDTVKGGVRYEEVPTMERYLKGLSKNMISTATGGFVGLRDISTFAMNVIFDGTDFGRSVNPFETAFRAGSEGYKALTLLAKMGKKNLELQEQEAKREQTYQEQLKKKKGKKRQEYIKKHEEAEKYRTPPHYITYSEILRHGAGALASATAARTGITSTLMDSITGTMQYMNDDNDRYDSRPWKIVWSALFDKKPIEREIPKKPAEPKEDKKKKKKKK